MDPGHLRGAQLVRRRARRAVLGALAALLVAGAAEPGHARREVVRWRQPQDESHTFFQVHVGRQSRVYDQVLLIGRPIHSNGVYAVSIPLKKGAPTYVAVSAYNLLGQGPLSNEIVFQDDGGRGPDGARGRGDGGGRDGRRNAGGGRGDSVEWADDEEFHSAVLPGLSESGAGAGVELSGRLQIDDPGAGIGVTFRAPFGDDEFYWLARDPAPGTPFTLESTFSTLACNGRLPVPEAGDWYRFRFQVVPYVQATVLSAKLWRKGAREPKEWTRCVDESAESLSQVEPGLWAIGPGVKSWKDVNVEPVKPEPRRARRRR